jgi:hypothetical protein
MKSRARDPYDITFGGYQIVNIRTNGLAGGHGNAGRGYEDLPPLFVDDVRYPIVHRVLLSSAAMWEYHK